MEKTDNVEETQYESSTSTVDNTFFGKLNKMSQKLDSFGVETRGIERIPPYERATNMTKQFISVTGFWLSATGGLPSMSSFFLGPMLFELSLKDSMVSGILGATFGCVIAAYLALMGPRSGCRQMVGARYLFGWWFVKPVALVSVIGVLGWSVVNCVVGGQILASVSDSKIPLPIGVLIVALISLFVAIFGIKQLLRVETLLSLPVQAAFLLLYICSAKEYSHLTTEKFETDYKTNVGNWLSFFSICYACTATWGSIASDYLILFPERTPDYQIFTLTFLGICIPTNFVGIVALLIGNVALTYEPWGETYADLGMGGLLNEAFSPWGAGGKVLTMILFLSLIANNIINTYSAAFDIQLAGVVFAKVPRWIWAIVVTCIYLACALIGRDHFSTILGNFLPMLGYWISMYFIILLEENTIFRSKWFVHLYTKEFEDVDKEETSHYSLNKFTKKQYYNWNIWNDYDKLTMGLAAAFSFCCGASGAVVGMAQAYWIGPVAAKIGAYGGDVALWLCMAFSGLVYPFCRYLELKRFGR